MIRASGNSSRIATIASKPLISGICRSINVTSGRHSRDSAIASRPLDASPHQLHVRFRNQKCGDANANQLMIVHHQNPNWRGIAHRLVDAFLLKMDRRPGLCA